LLKRFLLPFALCAATLAQAQVDPERTIAVVNGEVIKGTEFYRRMEYLPGVGRMVGNSFAKFSPGFLTLEQIITEKLIMQLAKEKGVSPSEQEVKDELAYIMSTDPGTVKGWKESGQTDEEFIIYLRYNLCQFKLLTRGITITDQEIDQFYKTNEVLFTTPKLVSLRVIAVQTAEQAAAVDLDIEGGKKFDEVAKARSLDLSDQARKSLEGVKVGGTTAWIVGGTTRVKFMVESITPEVKQPLDVNLRKRIRRELMLTKGKVKNEQALQQEMRDKRKTATIDIKDKVYAETYKQFIDNFLSGG
jgi:foldase protein PrsA